MPCSNGAAQPTFAWICQGFAIGLPVSLLGRQSPPGSVPEYPHSRSPTGQATAWMSCCGSTPSAAPGSKKWARLHHQDRPPGRAAQPGPLVPPDLRRQRAPADQGPSPTAHAATLLKNLGVPARDAQIILGHSRLAVTLEIYTHEDRQAQREALGRISEALGHASELPAANEKDGE